MQKKNAKQMQQKKLTNATKEAIKCNNRSKPQTNTTKEANKCNNRSKQKKQATKASKLLTGAVGDGVGAGVGLGVGAAVAGVGAQMPSYWRQYWNGAAHQLPAAWQLKSALPQLGAAAAPEERAARAKVGAERAFDRAGLGRRRRKVGARFRVRAAVRAVAEAAGAVRRHVEAQRRRLVEALLLAALLAVGAKAERVEKK